MTPATRRIRRGLNSRQLWNERQALREALTDLLNAAHRGVYHSGMLIDAVQRAEALLGVPEGERKAAAMHALEATREGQS